MMFGRVATVRVDNWGTASNVVGTNVDEDSEKAPCHHLEFLEEKELEADLADEELLSPKDLFLLSIGPEDD